MYVLKKMAFKIGLKNSRTCVGTCLTKSTQDPFRENAKTRKGNSER